MRSTKTNKSNLGILISTVVLILISIGAIWLNSSELDIFAKTKSSNNENGNDLSSEEETSSSSEGTADSSSEEETSSSSEGTADSSSEEETSSSSEGTVDSSSEEETSSSSEGTVDSSSEEETSLSNEENKNSSKEENLGSANSSNSDVFESIPNNEIVGKDNNLTNIVEEELEDNYYFSVIKNQTTESFIDQLKNDAQEIAWKNDLFASVMIAQAILETGSGNSTLSSAPNYNLFGVKGSYKRASVVMNTQEDDGTGNLFTIQSAFRKYPSYKESLEDYAILLREGVSGNPSFYQNTWKTNANSYRDVTAFLTGRYATDTNYGQKLNALIDAYQLTQYDTAPGTKNNKNDKREQVAAIEKEIIEKDGKYSKQSSRILQNDNLLYDEENQKHSELSNDIESLGLMNRKIHDIPSKTSVDFHS